MKGKNCTGAKYRFGWYLFLTLLLVGGLCPHGHAQEVSSLVSLNGEENDLGGVFIPRNGGIEGRIGRSHVFFNEHSGGVMSVVSNDWPNFESAAEMDMTFELKTKQAESPMVVKQSYDKNPKIFFLEEGGDRIGLRVLFNLYDAQHVFHGHGMTEIWLYPDGQMFVTAATMFENTAAHESVTAARLDVKLPENGGRSGMGSVDMTLPDGLVMLTKPKTQDQIPGLALYWKSGKTEHNTYIFRSSFGLKGAPSYFRWPDYFRQAYSQRTLPDYINAEGERAPWPPGRGAFLHELVANEEGVELRWPIESQVKNPTASFNAFFRLALVDNLEEAGSFVKAETEPIALAVDDGGVIHGGKDGYNDMEGCYEIRKTGKKATSVTLPSDPLQRTIRLKIIGLTGNGAVSVRLDGDLLVPQLSTDGGVADDPLAPIRDQPEGPANAAMVTVKLSDKQQNLVIQEEDGIQLVYQSRDTRRNFMIYSTKTGPRWSGLKFSLVDGHARHMRAYGNPEWALTENLLQWFAYMGYTPEQMLDQLRDFKVIKNGPDEIVFRYTSNNTNDGAQSVFEVTTKADAPAMHIDVKATFTVLEHWPYKSVQYFDIFPFRGVEPKDWWYDQVLFMDKYHKARTFETVAQIYQGEQDKHSIGSTFQGLFSSDRGNMLMLTKDFSSKLPTHYVICGNYVDLHSTVTFDNILQSTNNSLEKGYQFEVEYELAVWGDEKLRRDQMIEIAKKSIDANTLIIPSSVSGENEISEGK